MATVQKNKDEYMHKFDTFDYVIVDALNRDVFLSTPDLYKNLANNFGVKFVKKTLERRLEHLRDVLHWVEGERKGTTDFWRKADSLDPITGKSGPWQALAMKLMQRFMANKLPPVAAAPLLEHFAAAEETLRRHSLMAPQYEAWESKVASVSAGFHVSEPDVDDSVYGAITEALFHGQLIDIVRRPGLWIDQIQGMPERETVLPLGIVESDRCLYLVAVSSNGSSEPQMYRLDRTAICYDSMAHKKRISERLQAPQGFSLEAFIVEQKAFDLSPEGDIQIELLFRENSFWHLQNRKIGADQLTEIREDESIYVKATVTDSKKLRWWLREFGYKVEVPAPQVLRDRIRDDAIEVARLYGAQAEVRSLS